MPGRYILVALTTTMTMVAAVGTLAYALRDYAPVIANTYEVRRQGEGQTFKVNRGFSRAKIETISNQVKRGKAHVDLRGHIRP